MSGNTNSAAATFGAGRFACAARRTISNLTAAEMREIEGERSKARPTPWPHLAARYAVNELDLRRVVGSANDDARPAPKPVALDTLEDRVRLRDERFIVMWKQGTPRIDIMSALGISASTIDHTRARLQLPRRAPGRKTGDWTPEDIAYVRKHFIDGIQSPTTVGQALSRTRAAVVGLANREGWTRKPKKGPAK
jgi:hypothetical protein